MNDTPGRKRTGLLQTLLLHTETALADQLTPAVIAMAVFPVAGFCLAYSLRLPMLVGGLGGLALGLIPLALGRLQGTGLVLRSVAGLNFVLLAATSLATVVLIVPALLDGTVPGAEQPLPLLLAALALYVFYLLLNYLAVRARDLKPTRRLSLLLSGPPMNISLLMAMTISAYLLLTLHYFRLSQDSWVFYAEKFLDRGLIPPLTVMLFFWGLLLFFGKFWTLWREKQLLEQHRQDAMLVQLHQQHLAEYKNTSVEVWLDLVWKKAAEFYVVPRYINWAIPILGFIGTVLGISLAADGIQQIIGSQQGTDQLSSNLGQAISPLGIAFDTTLIALSLSIVLTLIQTLLQRWEDGLLLDYESHLRLDEDGDGAADS